MSSFAGVRVFYAAGAIRTAMVVHPRFLRNTTKPFFVWRFTVEILSQSLKAVAASCGLVAADGADRGFAPRFGPVRRGRSKDVGTGTPSPIPMTVALAPGSAYGPHSDGITTSTIVQVVGQTAAGIKVGVNPSNNGGAPSVTQVDSSGRFTLTAAVRMGANLLNFGPVVGGKINDQTSLVIVCWPRPAARNFNGSPTPAGQPAGRLIKSSRAYAKGLPPRPPAKMLSRAMVEDPKNPAFSPNIVLGLVFFGQFVDHDVTLNDTTAGQGPSILTNAGQPIDLRTPALDLDSVYGLGPHEEADFYTTDGLFFQFGNAAGTDLQRDSEGVAIIGDPQ